MAKKKTIISEKIFYLSIKSLYALKYQIIYAVFLCLR